MGVVLDFGKIGGGENPLCVSFPTLYVVAASKGATMGQVWETTGEGGWNPRFVRPFNDWEMEENQRLISLISSRKVKSLLGGER